MKTKLWLAQLFILTIAVVWIVPDMRLWRYALLGICIGVYARLEVKIERIEEKQND